VPNTGNDCSFNSSYFNWIFIIFSWSDVNVVIKPFLNNTIPFYNKFIEGCFIFNWCVDWNYSCKTFTTIFVSYVW